MLFQSLSYEQARMAMILGHGVRHPGLPAGAFLLARRADSAPPPGFTQQIHWPSAAEQVRNDWEIV
jgi:hypothetical protein